MISYGKQLLTNDDIDAVINVLKSDFLTQGPQVEMFEAAVSSYVGVEHSVAVNSATSALHIAYLALGLGPGDILWTSPNTFVSTANCAIMCGAEVDFVDIDPKDFNMSTSALATKLEVAAENGRLPKIVVPVHFSGRPCDMSEIHRLSQKYGFSIVEDASHAIGATHDGTAIGACKQSDIVVFSFHPVKIITTGEGGMATTRDNQLAEKMRLIRTSGVTRDPRKMDRIPDGDWYYQQTCLGLNYRMPDILAALGSSQLTRISEFLSQRRELASRYARELSDLNMQLPNLESDDQSAWHLYVVQSDILNDRDSKVNVFKGFRERGIGVNVHYIPVHTQPYYRSMGFRHGNFPVAESYYKRALTLPLHPGMTNGDQDSVVAAVRELLG